MYLPYLTRLFGVAMCSALVCCSGIDEDEDDSDRENGYSLDNAPTSQNRYMAGPGNIIAAPASTTTQTTTVETIEPAPTVTESTTTTATVTPPAVTTTTTATTPAAPATSAQPSYGSPVAGRRGFVYPPGVEAKPENMVDVRDFTPGQKVRDPRTGKIFLVP